MATASAALTPTTGLKATATLSGLMAFSAVRLILVRAAIALGGPAARRSSVCHAQAVTTMVTAHIALHLIICLGFIAPIKSIAVTSAVKQVRAVAVSASVETVASLMSAPTAQTATAMATAFKLPVLMGHAPQVAVRAQKV